MEQNKSTREMDLRVDIDAPAEAVWKAISEAEEIVKWFAPEVRVEPGAGGSVWLSWGPGMGASERIEIWEPGKHLRLVHGASEAPRVIDFFIDARDDGTAVLRVVHSGFGADASFDDEYDSTHGGWTTFFVMLKYLLEAKRSEKAENVTVFIPAEASGEECWRKLTGPGALAAEGSLEGLRPGDRYRVKTALGEMLSGEVLRMQAPPTRRQGYAVLSIEEMSGSLLGLFCEGSGDKSYVTVTWILYGEAVEQAAEVRGRWESLLGEVFPRGAAA